MGQILERKKTMTSINNGKRVDLKTTSSNLTSIDFFHIGHILSVYSAAKAIAKLIPD